MKKLMLMIALVVVFLAGSVGSSFIGTSDKKVVSVKAVELPHTAISISPTQIPLPTPTQVVQPIKSINNINVNVAPAIINNNVKVEIVPAPPTVVNNYVTNVTNVTNVCNCSQPTTEGRGALPDSGPGPVSSPTPAPVMVAPVLEEINVQESGLIILYIKNNKAALDWSMYLHMTTSSSAEDLRIDLGQIGTIVSQVADGGIYGHSTTRMTSDYPSGTILTFWATYHIDCDSFLVRETAPSNMVQITIP